MGQTSRERVSRCLRFAHPDRAPWDVWVLPYVSSRFPETVRELERRFPSDFGSPPNVYRPSPRVKGDAYAIGEYVDEWGATFTNIHGGVIGEVRAPLLAEIGDWRAARPPHETLPADPGTARAAVDRACAQTERFVRAGCCPRPWERYQFLRGSQNALTDIMTFDAGGADLLRVIHEFHLREVEFWATTGVDAIGFMDDWGSQRQLLIPPALWRQFFKPLYRDYCELAHAHGKFAFMHSDGHIAEIYDDLVEIGVDALNSQLFCMDMADLARRAKGKLTFWGEIDRQHVLPAHDPQVGRAAVREVAKHFYDPAGGVIAQFEFTPGSNPATAVAIFEEWEQVQREVAGATNDKKC